MRHKRGSALRVVWLSIIFVLVLLLALPAQADDVVGQSGDGENTQAKKPSVKLWVDRHPGEPKHYQNGQRAFRRFAGGVRDQALGYKLDYIIKLPDGASDVQFEGRPPDSNPSPGVYVWNNVAVEPDGDAEPIGINFVVPPA